MSGCLQQTELKGFYVRELQWHELLNTLLSASDSILAMNTPMDGVFVSNSITLQIDLK